MALKNSLKIDVPIVPIVEGQQCFVACLPARACLLPAVLINRLNLKYSNQNAFQYTSKAIHVIAKRFEAQKTRNGNFQRLRSFSDQQQQKKRTTAMCNRQRFTLLI